MKKQRGEAITAILIANLIVALIPQIQKAASDGKPVCGAEGFLRDAYNLQQVIGENGGGIRCFIIDSAGSPAYPEKKGDPSAEDVASSKPLTSPIQ